MISQNKSTEASWLVPRRRHAPELMDAPGLPPEEVADAYRVLRRINGWFFGGRPTLRIELSRWIRTESEARSEHGTTGLERPINGPVTFVEIGSGSGDLAREAGTIFARDGVPARVAVLDLDPTALRLARAEGLDAVRGDALRLPWADRSIDVLLAVKFAHHFSGDALDRLIAEMTRVARRCVLVLDIRRSWLAYAGFVAWSRIFTRNRLVRYDGPLSVLRGFTPGELAALVAEQTDFAWEIRRHRGFQLALVGRRRTGAE